MQILLQNINTYIITIAKTASCLHLWNVLNWLKTYQQYTSKTHKNKFVITINADLFYLFWLANPSSKLKPLHTLNIISVKLTEKHYTCRHKKTNPDFRRETHKISHIS